MRVWVSVAAVVVLNATPTAAQSMRDSADIQIIENAGPAWSPEEAWTVATSPSLEIGAVDGPAELLFSNIEAVVVSSDGRIIVADRGSGQVRFFHPSGLYEASFGGPGEGPGEFLWLAWLGECGGGEILAYDRRLARVTSVRPGMTSAETWPIRSDGNRAPNEVRCTDTGLVGATRTFGMPPSTPGPVRWPTRIEIFPTDSAPRTLAEVPGDDRFFQNGDLGPRPLGRRTVIAARGSEVAIGTADAPEVMFHDVRTDIRRLVRWSDSSLDVRAEDIHAFTEGLVEAASSPERARQIRIQLRDHPFPERLPAYGRVLFDREGNLWVEHTRRPGESLNWWRVLSPSGELLGSLRLPSRFEPMSITSSQVAGVWRDGLDVEYVWVLELRK